MPPSWLHPCKLNFMCISLPALVWSYFSCGTILPSGLKINAKVLEGKHSYATVKEEED